MLSWQILRHSMNMVFNNFGVALRISIPLIGAMVLTLLLFGREVVMGQTGLDMMNPQPYDAVNEGKVFLAAMIEAFAVLWVAVAWHRYILLEETPTGTLPAFNGSRMLSYFGHGLLLAVVVIAVFAGFGLVGGLIMATGSSILVVAGGAIMIVGGLAVNVVAARLYVVLPAAAIGRSMKLSAAWEATKGYAGAIIAAYVFFILIAIVIGIIVGLSTAFLGIVGMIFVIALNVILTMIGISFLTTIYGVAIERRELT